MQTSWGRALSAGKKTARTWSGDGRAGCSARSRQRSLCEVQSACWQALEKQAQLLHRSQCLSPERLQQTAHFVNGIGDIVSGESMVEAGWSWRCAVPRGDDGGCGPIWQIGKAMVSSSRAL